MSQFILTHDGKDFTIALDQWYFVPGVQSLAVIGGVNSPPHISLTVIQWEENFFRLEEAGFVMKEERIDPLSKIVYRTYFNA